MSRRLRLPLSFVVGRYFVYVLIGALGAVGVPLMMLYAMLVNGQVLPANYGPGHLDETVEVLTSREVFDPSVISAAYGYAYFDAADVARAAAAQADAETVQDADGARPDIAEEAASMLAADAAENMADAEIARAAALVLSAATAPASLPEDPTYEVDATSAGGMYPTAYQEVRLRDGSWCVLTSQLLPQWSDRDIRASWPNPQTLMLGIGGVGLVVVIVVVALRASHVLSRKMRPLTEAAEATGAGNLDVAVGSSNVAQIDDVLGAMDRMRTSLKGSLEEQWASEQAQREQVTLLAHKIKTPLTVARGNAELLAEEAEKLGLSADSRAELEALHAATLEANRCVGRLIAATRGMSVPPEEGSRS